MSRTKKVEFVENPVSHYISFHGKTGKIGIREAGGKGFLDLPTPFNFVVIDADARKVSGKKSQKKNSPIFTSNLTHPGYNANEYSVTTDQSEAVLTSGKWKNIKENPAIKGARLTQLVYAIWERDFAGEMLRDLVCISLHGRALSKWIEVSKKFPPTGNFIFSVTGFEEMSSEENETVSQVPVFSAVEVEEDNDTILAAIDADENALQPYFKFYFERLKADPAGQQKQQITETTEIEEEETEEFEEV